MFIAEEGIAVSLVAVDLGEGRQHSKSYRAINPRRVVPTLVPEDGPAIGEVLAIWRYLEEVYSDAASIRIGAERQGAGYHVGTAHRARGFCGCHRRHSRRFGTAGNAARLPDPPFTIDSGAGRAQQASGEKLLRRSRRPFGCAALCCQRSFFGGRYHRLATVDFATKAMSFPPPNEHKALRRWFEKVSSRPSAAA